jgi:gliding motility-associated-like protein
MVQMKRYLLFLLIPVLCGCFEDEPQLPQYYAKQEIDVAVDSVICYSQQEDFDSFILTCSEPFDSVHWYRGYFNPEFLESGQPFEIQNVPHGLGGIKCLGFNGSDTTVYDLQLYYCARYMYIPVAFSPNEDAMNDSWFPVYYYTYADTLFKPFSIHWEIRTLDGTKIFETDDVRGRWDGTFNDHLMPRGSYLYYIELKISGENLVEYTGWLEMLG